MKSIKFILSCFKNSVIKIFIYIISALFFTYLITLIPIIIQTFVDKILGNKVNNSIIRQFINTNSIFNLILYTCIVLILIKLISQLFSYINKINKSKIMYDFQFELKRKMFSFIQELTYQDFYMNSLADLVQNSTSDVNKIVSFINEQFFTLFETIILLIFAVIRLAQIDYRFSLIILVSSLLIILASLIYYKLSKPYIETEIKLQNKIYTKMENNFNYLKFIKLNNLQESEISEFNKITHDQLENNKKSINIITYYQMFVENIVKLQTPIILIISAFLLLNNQITLGIIYIVISYANSVTKSFVDMADTIAAFNSFIISFKRINKLLKLTIEDSHITTRLNTTNLKIKFENVSIIINEEIILENINFEISPNEKVLIVGSTGSGKSILVKTIIGFYEYSGSIKIGDIELKTLNKKEIRDCICLILQDSYIFSKTIAENIKMLNPELNYTDMTEISKVFMLHDDVINFKNGYEMALEKKGSNLSKGQRQRLILTRAFSKHKPIMILDDSFSAIDNINKKHILNNLLNNKNNFSLIMIGFDLTKVNFFDKIIFINSKKVLVGSHNKLLENKDYKRLYDSTKDKVGEEYV